MVDNEMTPSISQTTHLTDLCDRLKQMGYAQSKRIRIYGEDFEVISNPFPQGNGIAVQAKSGREKQSRVLQLPLPILQMVSPRKTA
jgi:hypothetical protein